MQTVYKFLSLRLGPGDPLIDGMSSQDCSNSNVGGPRRAASQSNDANGATNPSRQLPTDPTRVLVVSPLPPCLTSSYRRSLTDRSFFSQPARPPSIAIPTMPRH